MHQKRGSAIGQILIDELSLAHQVVFNGKPLTDENIGLSPLPPVTSRPLPRLNLRRQICPVTTVWFKFGRAVLKSLSSLPISLGFEDRVTFRRPVARHGGR